MGVWVLLNLPNEGSSQNLPPLFPFGNFAFEVFPGEFPQHYYKEHQIKKMIVTTIAYDSSPLQYEYECNREGQLISQAEIQEDGNKGIAIKWKWTEAGCPRIAINPGVGKQFSCDSLGRIVSVRSSIRDVSIEWDDHNRITRLISKTDSVEVSDFQYNDEGAIVLALVKYYSVEKFGEVNLNERVSLPDICLDVLMDGKPNIVRHNCRQQIWLVAEEFAPFSWRLYSSRGIEVSPTMMETILDEKGRVLEYSYYRRYEGELIKVNFYRFEYETW